MRDASSKRVTATVTEETYKLLEYWANKHNISINQYLNDALDLKIRYENKDYDMPTLEQARLNQLIEVIGTLSSDVRNLTSVTTSGFDSLLGLTRGDNYLLDYEDGEI